MLYIHMSDNRQQREIKTWRGAGLDRGELDCIFSLTAANQVRENLKKEREKRNFVLLLILPESITNPKSHTKVWRKKIINFKIKLRHYRLESFG